jgi:hypothetical protein
MHTYSSEEQAVELLKLFFPGLESIQITQIISLDTVLQENRERSLFPPWLCLRGIYPAICRYGKRSFDGGNSTPRIRMQNDGVDPV